MADDNFDDETMLMLYDEFIAKMNLDDAFAEYLKLVANDVAAERKVTP
jgi:hypothetical protein